MDHPAASIGHCAKVELISCLMHALAISSTALLFFFRVRAIFDRNKLVVAFFALLWVMVVAGTLAVIPGVAGANIGPTNYCMLIKSEPYVATAAVIPLVNDTLVFLAISWRLMECAHAEMSVRTGLRILAFGDHLLPLSKALLQDGQMYYLYSLDSCSHPSLANIFSRTTVTAGIMTVIMHFVHVVPAAYKTMFTIPNVTVMSMMAGRVFRNTKFGHFKESSISTSSILFSLGDQKNRNTPPRSAAIPPTGTVQFTNWEETSRNTQSLEIPVEVTVQSEHWRKGSDGKYVDQKSGYSEVV